MTTSITLHSHTMNDGLQFSSQPMNPENNNCVKLKFDSLEFFDVKKSGTYKVKNEITIFSLDDATAAGLSMLGQLDLEYRTKLVPILEHMLAEQNATGGSDG